jgi:hypothetical protein
VPPPPPAAPAPSAAGAASSSGKVGGCGVVAWTWVPNRVQGVHSGSGDGHVR